MAQTIDPKDLGKYRKSAPSKSSSQKNATQSKGLAKEYLQGGYFDQSEHLKREYIVEYPQQIANQLAYDKFQQMSAAGLRRFFTKVRFLERKLEAKGDFAAVVPELLALIPYVHNAKTRKVVPQLFQQFIEQNVNAAVQSEHAFREGFLKHFEYVVAFFPKSR